MFFPDSRKLLCLPESVLPGMTIQNEEDLIRVTPEGFGGDAEYFFQFCHKAEAGLLAPCGVRKDAIYVSGTSGFYGREQHRGGVAFGGSLDDVHLQALRPYLNLLCGTCPEGIARGEEDGLAFLFQAMGEFGEGGGLPGAVDSHEEIKGRGVLRVAEFPLRRGETLPDNLAKGKPQVFCLIPVGVFPGIIPELAQKVFGFPGSRIRHKEDFFQFFKELVIYSPSGEKGMEAFFEARKDFEGHIKRRGDTGEESWAGDPE
jgi:hypothetical protein